MSAGINFDVENDREHRELLNSTMGAALAGPDVESAPPLTLIIHDILVLPSTPMPCCLNW